MIDSIPWASLLKHRAPPAVDAIASNCRRSPIYWQPARYIDQLSEEMIGSGLDSASFNRSALLMYFDLLDGANLALAFLA